jgi:hypothetical protein
MEEKEPKNRPETLKVNTIFVSSYGKIFFLIHSYKNQGILMWGGKCSLTQRFNAEIFHLSAYSRCVLLIHPNFTNLVKQ